MERKQLIEEIFLDGYLGKENKDRDYAHYVKPLNPQDGIGYSCVFRIRLSKTAAILVGIQINVAKEEKNTNCYLTYIDSGQDPKTRYRKWLTMTFFRKREHYLGLGIDEIIRRIAPILAEKLEKAERLYHG